MKEYYATHPDYSTGDNSDFESNEQNIYTWIFNEKFEEYVDNLVNKAEIEYVDFTVNSDSLN